MPDWVYEEEVFSSDSALWWSPDSRKLAYLRFDETAVEEYTFPVYNPTEDSYKVVPYPSHVTMKYPKPGYANPLVSIHVCELDRYRDMRADGDSEAVAVTQANLELTWDNRLPPENRIVQDVAWVGNATLLVEELDRAAVNGSIVLFNLEEGAVNLGQVVRKLGQHGEESDEGWIEPVSFSRSDGVTLVLTRDRSTLSILYLQACLWTDRRVTSTSYRRKKALTTSRSSTPLRPLPHSSSLLVSGK